MIEICVYEQETLFLNLDLSPFVIVKNFFEKIKLIPAIVEKYCQNK